MPKAVSEFLSVVNLQAAEDVNNLVQALTDSSTSGEAGAVAPIMDAKVTLGCCIYNGGKTGNLTLSQCSQYNHLKWDSSDPGCTRSDR